MTATWSGLFDDRTEDAPKWCRARIEGRVRDEEAGVDLFKVLYIDYGNTENVPASRYRDVTCCSTAISSWHRLWW